MVVPKLLITAGLMAAQMALGATRKIEGPRLDDLNVSMADYGTPLEDFWGIRRLEGRPIIWAEKLREKKKKSKTKGGKYTEYKYYGTWAVAIAGHEIDAVTRIWLDKHPVYQMTGEGPVAALILTAIDPEAQGSIKVGANSMAIYLGTEDQDVDPRIEAWCEDRYGAGSASAYRGTSYIVFKDIPLEKFGNRIPQVDVEAVRVKSVSYPYETLYTNAGADSFFAYGGGYVAWVNTAGGIEWWDSASRTLLGYSLPPGTLVSSSITALGSNGVAYTVGVTAGPVKLWLVETYPVGTPVLTEIEDWASVFVSNIRVFGNTAYTAYGDAEGYIRHTTHIPPSVPNYSARDFCVDDHGEVWILWQELGSSDNYIISNTADLTSYLFSGSAVRSGLTSAKFCFRGDSFFIDGADGYFYIVNRDTGAVTDSGTAPWTRPAIPADTPNSKTFWDAQFDEYSLEDGSLIRDMGPGDWVFTASDEVGYDPLLHALWSRQGLSSPNTMHVFYLDRLGSGGVTLGTIVDSDSDRVNVNADVSDLDQPVVGYSTAPGTVRERIEHLLDAHDSICRTHDFGVQFIKRGTSSQGIIETSDFVRDGARYNVEIDQDTDLPIEVTVKFADKNADQQVNTVTSRRATDAVDSDRTQQLDMSTYVGLPDEMQKLADRWLRRKWNSRATVSNGLTAQHMAAECGDVYDLDLDGVLWTVELEQLTFSGGFLKCNWRRTFPSLNALGDGTGPDMDGRDEDPIVIPGPTKGFVLDLPLLTDAHSSANPLLYYAAGGYNTGSWLGASILEGDLDGEEYSEWNAVDSSNGATWGLAQTALADVPSPWLWDRGNSVTVNVFGTLSNATEAEIDADETVNQAYLGGEVLNFTTATLTGTEGSANVYEISGFKRGRRGTEWATGDHAIGEDFLLLSYAGNDGMGLSEVGDHKFFKAQSLGRDPEMGTPIEVDFSGASLKPYAPARINWSTDGTDLFGEIIRRTRVGGSWTGGSTIPLSENSEAYEVDVLDGSDNVLDTIEVTGTNTFTITAAELSGYGYSLTSLPSVNVYQLSDAVGRGFALAA